MPLCLLSRAWEEAVDIVAPHSNSIGHGVHATTSPAAPASRAFVGTEGTDLCSI